MHSSTAVSAIRAISNARASESSALDAARRASLCERPCSVHQRWWPELSEGECNRSVAADAGAGPSALCLPRPQQTRRGDDTSGPMPHAPSTHSQRGLLVILLLHTINYKSKYKL